MDEMRQAVTAEVVQPAGHAIQIAGGTGMVGVGLTDGAVGGLVASDRALLAVVGGGLMSHF